MKFKDITFDLGSPSNFRRLGKLESNQYNCPILSLFSCLLLEIAGLWYSWFWVTSFLPCTPIWQFSVRKLVTSFIKDSFHVSENISNIYFSD